MSSSRRPLPNGRIDSGISGCSPTSPIVYSPTTSPAPWSQYPTASPGTHSYGTELPSEASSSARLTGRSATPLSSRHDKKKKVSKKPLKLWPSKRSPNTSSNPSHAQDTFPASSAVTSSQATGPARASNLQKSPSYNQVPTAPIDWWRPEEPTHALQSRPNVSQSSDTTKKQPSRHSLIRNKSSFYIDVEDSSEEDVGHVPPSRGKSEKADPTARPDSGLFCMPTPPGSVDPGLHGRLHAQLPGAALTANKRISLRHAMRVGGRNGLDDRV